VSRKVEKLLEDGLVLDVLRNNEYIGVKAMSLLSQVNKSLYAFFKADLDKARAKVLSQEGLTENAANFMIENNLVIRNSHTKQLISLHLGRGSFPKTHTPGGGQYCVPLWTVAIPQLMDIEASYKNKDLIAKVIDDYNKKISYVDCRRYHLNYETDKCYQIASLTENEKKIHLDAFLQRIKDFIGPWTPFGRCSLLSFDYELIVAKGDSKILSDFGRYSTGARGHCDIHKNNIVYRATLNDFEIKFLKKVLMGEYDNMIPGIEKVIDDVIKSVRVLLCDMLATEIIGLKITRFLNAAGKLTKVITLNQTELNDLLQNTIESDIVKKYMEEGSIRVTSPDDYLALEKYSPGKS
jgi:hypothetical protein